MSDGMAVVVAQARPASVPSMYQGNIIGQYAFPEKEPAVFYAIEQQVPVRDIKATTQEDNSVRQDVTPIYCPDGRCVAVLVCERDMEWELRREKKLEYLSHLPAGSGSLLFSQYPGSCQELALREVHHRIKNNLQTVASILNLQARRCDDPATKKFLEENVGRVLSIAAVHDILTSSTDGFDETDSLELLEKLKTVCLRLVRATVQEKLHGHLSIHSCGDGSKVTFDFKIK